MKKIFVILVLALLLTACGGGYQVTPTMRAGMEGYAKQVAMWWPEQENICEVCLSKETTVYWSQSLRAYAVTCQLDRNPDSFGVITFDEFENFLNAFSISAASQGEVTSTLGQMGWKR